MDYEEHASDDRQPSTQERGQMLASIKRWALIGYAQEHGGSGEGFEKFWREAFHADEGAEAKAGVTD